MKLICVVNIFIFLVEYPWVIKTDECNIQQTCSECIGKNAKCAWCVRNSLDENDEVPRCDLLANIRRNCELNNIVNPVKSLKIIKNLPLSDKGAKEGDAIQIKPQEIRIKLRPNSAQAFKLEFRQAVDYPVDLYYLMDLSNTMSDDKESLSNLGDKLSREMKNITSNFRLGFGSFVDKTVAPFIKVSYRNPYVGRAYPYGFHNHMPLSENIAVFAQKVKAAPMSINLDASEGGFDALMQAVVCEDQIGWRLKARKLILFATDDSFHIAGDGKMGGIITPNDMQCHLSHDGYYNMTNLLDYPSVGQLKQQIENHKVNVIFAVTDWNENLYKSLADRLRGSSTGKLKRDSSNIVDLVRDQYNKITSAVEITDDNSDPNIVISYFSKCFGKKKKETNTCTKLKVGTNVTFEVKFEILSCPSDRNQWKRTVHISPVGLQDQIVVNLEMICECNCEKTSHNVSANNSEICGEDGSFQCGICKCDPLKKTGKRCECDITKESYYVDDKACHRENDTDPCSGAGVCRCGQCDCYKRQNSNEKIYGPHCECNNFNCDKVNGKYCSGHGNCDCGTCSCLNGWKGIDCSCSDSLATCTGPDNEICSNRGTCDCGSCKCNSNEYFGKYCDDCPTCPGKCDELKDCVKCSIKMKNANNCTSCGSTTVTLIETIEVKDKEKLCSFDDEMNCRHTFKYAFDEEKNLKLWSKMQKECPQPVDLIAIVSGVSGGIVGVGLFLLMLWKVLTVVHDRREWAKFERDMKNAKWNQAQNPLYKEVQTTYRNPAFGTHELTDADLSAVMEYQKSDATE